MPELPEVETIARSLRRFLPGKAISTCSICYSKILTNKPDHFKKNVCRNTFRAVERHGKYLFLKLDRGITLAIHLRMTGQLLILPRKQGTDRHTHLELFLNSSPNKLVYRDVRKFGRITLLEQVSIQEFVHKLKLGPDALGVRETSVWPFFRSRDRMLKALLLDQSFIAGLGNIYTDEVLFLARLLPERKSGTVSRSEFRTLLNRMHEVLQKAVANGGTTFSDYREPGGKKGRHQQALLVYKRQSLPCVRCDRPIEKIRVAGRGTYFCSFCQKKPDGQGK